MQEHILSPSKSNRPKRRSYTKEFKAGLVAQCDQGDQSLAQIAMDHQINANMLRKWQREAHLNPTTNALLPVAVEQPASHTGSDRDSHRFSDCPIQRTGRSGQCQYYPESASMITPPARSRIWLAAGVTDMRKGMPGLATLVFSALDKDPLSGDVFVFRGRRGDQIKVLWFSGDGTNLYIKRLERGRFIWPAADEGVALLTPAQFSMLCEAIDWRAPDRTWWPAVSMG